jgi:hypothetical protein
VTPVRPLITQKGNRTTRQDHNMSDKNSTKSKTDQTTDGKGKTADEKKRGLLAKIASLFDDDSAGDADLDGAGTSTDETEGDEVDEMVEPDEEAETSAEPGDAESAEAEESEPDEEVADEPLPGDDGKKKFTQTDLNNLVNERLAKQAKRLRKEFAKEKDGMDRRITALQKQINGYLESDKANVQAAFDALPEVVRKSAPAKNLDSPKNIAAIKRWLPSVQELAKAVSGRPGNSGSFQPIGTTPDSAEDELVAKAKKHSIYASF